MEKRGLALGAPLQGGGDWNRESKGPVPPPQNKFFGGPEGGGGGGCVLLSLHCMFLLVQRALELLSLPKDCPPLLLLDIGCGTGLSGQVLEQMGHHWVGTDIADAMLSVAVDRGLCCGAGGRGRGCVVPWTGVLGFGLPYSTAAPLHPLLCSAGGLHLSV